MSGNYTPRAVLLAALVLVSVAGGAFGFAGTAAADSDPATDEWINDQSQTVTYNATDSFGNNETVLVTVTNPTSNVGVTYEINPDATVTDGVSIDRDDGEVTVDPTDDRIDGWVDGIVELSIEGDTNYRSHAFYVDTVDPSFDFSYSSSDFNGDLTDDDRPDLDVTANAQDTVSGDSVELTSATVEINGPDGYQVTLENGTYPGVSETFDLNPSSNSDVDDFSASGKYTITVDAEDESGNTASSSDSFWVDRQDVNATNVDVDFSGSVLSDQDIAASGTNGTVTVTFDENTLFGSEIEESDVAVEFTSDNAGLDGVQIINFQKVSANEVAVDLNAANYANGEYSDLDGVVDDDVTVEVVGAGDTAGNGFGNADAGASNTSLDVLTSTPDVSVDESELPTVSEDGYVNVSSAIETEQGEVVSDIGDGVYDDDVLADEVSITLRFGSTAVGTGGYTLDITKDANNLFVEELPDTLSDYEFVVTATNTTANNVGANTAGDGLTVDKGDEVTVTDEYRHAVQVDGDYIQYTEFAEPVESTSGYQAHTGTVDLDEVFENQVGAADLTYTVNGDEVGSTLSVTEYENEEIEVTATAEDASGTEFGNSVTVGFDFAPNVGAHVDNENQELYVGLNAVDDLSELQIGLDTVDNYDADLDDYLDNNVSDLDQSDFNSETWSYTVPDAASRTTTESHVYYTWTDSSYSDQIPRDGQFEADVTAATAPNTNTAGVAADFAHNADATSNVDETFEIDYSAPRLVHATLTDSDLETATAQAWFDEPVSDTGSFTFAGDDATVTGSSGDSTTGIVDVSLDNEPQTVDAPALTATVAESQFGSNAGATEHGVFTHTLTLTEGQNVVSIPAVTGDIPADTFDHNEINNVWSYDAATGTFDSNANSLGNVDLNPGEGYVVYAAEDTYVGVNAMNVLEEDNQAPAGASMAEDSWNLVGHYQLGDQPVDQALTTLGDATYDVQKGYEYEVTGLESGEGYWVFSDASGLHTPVPYDGMDSEKPQIIDVQVDQNSDDPSLVNITASVSHEHDIAEVLVDGDVNAEIIENTDRAAGGTDFTLVGVDAGARNLDLEVTATDVNGNFDSMSLGNVDNPVEPANFDVTIDSVDDPATETEDITVDYTVENTGDLTDTQTIGFAVDQSPTDSSSITLDGSATTSGSFTYTTVEGDTDSVDLSLRSQDDTTSDTADVDALEATTVTTLSAADNPVSNNSNTDLTATVQDQLGNAFDGEQVDFKITNTSSGSIASTLDGSGTTANASTTDGDAVVTLNARSDNDTGETLTIRAAAQDGDITTGNVAEDDLVEEFTVEIEP